MTDISRDELVEQSQEMLVNSLAYAEAGMANLHKQRDLAVKTVTLRLQTERYRDQMEMRDKLNLLGGAIDSLAKTTENLPKGPRDDIAAQLAALSSQVQQVLAGGPDRPMLLDELPRWIELRAGHAQEKKIKTDSNRIRDFVEYAGDRPVNRYRFSDFQGFTNVLARSPANMSKERTFHRMTREQAADYNSGLPEKHRFDTLTGKAIEANYLSPLRMFFKSMAAEYDFRSPLADMSPSIPNTARDSVVRVPFTVEELDIWFKAAAEEARPDLKWLPLLATLTGACVGELIFLQGKDIYKVTDTLWVADLTTDLVIEGEETERQIKNESSRRLFALHEVLEQTVCPRAWTCRPISLSRRHRCRRKSTPFQPFTKVVFDPESGLFRLLGRPRQSAARWLLLLWWLEIVASLPSTGSRDE